MSPSETRAPTNEEIAHRCWRDGARHWFDGMLNGYYMDEGETGIYRDDGALVPTTGRTWIHSHEEFVAVVGCIYAAHPEWLP